METESFVLVQPLRVVQLSESAEGSITALLPVGARIRITGRSSIPGCVEVVCANVKYSAFEENLRDRSDSDDVSENPKRRQAKST
jgi:hypothetical protein